MTSNIYKVYLANCILKQLFNRIIIKIVREHFVTMSEETNLIQSVLTLLTSSNSQSYVNFTSQKS